MLRLVGKGLRWCRNHPETWIVLAVLFGYITLAVKGRPEPPELKQPGVLSSGVLDPRAQGPDVGNAELLTLAMEQYKDRLSQFDTNVKLQGLFIGLAILLMIRSSNKVSFFGTDVPLGWLHLLVPVVLVYLWLSFGFILDSLIEGRLRGIEILHRMNDAKQVESLQDGLAGFSDAGLVDGWFMTFVDEHIILQDASGRWLQASSIEADADSEQGTAIFLMVVLGLLISLSHAAILGTIYIAGHRYALSRAQRHFWMLLLVFILTKSHLQFAYGGENPNQIQLWFPLLTIVLFAWYRVLARRADERLDTGLVSAALIGDSLSTGFYVSSPLSMLWRAWFYATSGWFCGRHRSVVSRVGMGEPCQPFSLARPKARVVPESTFQLSDLAIGVDHFAGQVDRLLSLDVCPDLVLVWIGHNDLDWADGKGPDAELTEAAIVERADAFEATYRHELRRLVNALEASPRCHALVCYGLANFGAFFEARAQAAEIRARDGDKYPYFERDLAYFPSMATPFQTGMIELALVYDQRIKALVEEVASLAETKVVFSSAMSDARISMAHLIHDVDAWHPSPAGHDVLAEAAVGDARSALGSIRPH